MFAFWSLMVCTQVGNWESIEGHVIPCCGEGVRREELKEGEGEGEKEKKKEIITIGLVNFN